MSRTSDDCRALAIIIQRSQPLQHGRAFGSPDRSDETGLPIHRSEKMKASREGRTGESILSSAVREEKFANWRAFREDFNELRPEFASAQTVWRRERDSNSRYGFGLQSLDVSVSCREENLSREFHIKIRRESLLRR